MFSFSLHKFLTCKRTESIEKNSFSNGSAFNFKSMDDMAWHNCKTSSAEAEPNRLGWVEMYSKRQKLSPMAFDSSDFHVNPCDAFVLSSFTIHYSLVTLPSKPSYVKVKVYCT